jgi:transcription-repair coupling factor (superfamily II helicase)
VAHELLEIAASRKLQEIHRPTVAQHKMYKEFTDLFPFDLTPDQDSALAAIELDLKQPWPMDRLVCGDVGFGKTEVALRAAFVSLLSGKQVALLAPTTLLVEQHFRTIQRRLDPFPFKVAHLSRFVSSKDQAKILRDLKDGKLDVVIGTHRLLQTDVHFKNLGLLIVDEEQRFGVKHKEKMKRLRISSDVLTLSATPIPRTLQMSILGIRDLSLIATPPESREAVKTTVGAFDESLIRRACLRERERGGQILFVHNRVQSILNLENRLKKFLPEFRIVVAHGQMKEAELEKRMMTFLDQKADILLSTSIIEHGLDIPSANTLFVDHAEMFGLSDLYQLRGRVGRSSLAAYAYFLIHEDTQLTPEASKRLQVIQSFTELGSGFHVATHDMEIRGSGNLLGMEQSGVIAEVGLELYSEMLQETLSELKRESLSSPLPEINSGYTAYIPDSYLPDPTLRIATYKRLDRLKTLEQVIEFESELLDRFGLYPPEVENLCQLTRLRVMAYELHVASLEVFPGRLSLLFKESTPLTPDTILPLLQKNCTLDPKGRLTFSFESKLRKNDSLDSTAKSPPELHDFKVCRQFLEKLVDCIRPLAKSSEIKDNVER